MVSSSRIARWSAARDRDLRTRGRRCRACGSPRSSAARPLSGGRSPPCGAARKSPVCSQAWRRWSASRMLVVRHARVLDAVAHARRGARARRARDWRGSRVTGTRSPTFRRRADLDLERPSLRARSRSLRPRVADEMARATATRDGARQLQDWLLTPARRRHRHGTAACDRRAVGETGMARVARGTRAPRSGDAGGSVALPRVGRRRYVGGSRDAAAARDRTDAGDVGIAGGVACGCCHETSADDRRHVPVVVCRCLEQRLVVDPRCGERDSLFRAGGPRLRGVRPRDAGAARARALRLDADRRVRGDVARAAPGRAAGAPESRRKRARSPSQAGPARRMVGAAHRRGAAALSHSGADPVGLSRPLRAGALARRAGGRHVRAWLEALGEFDALAVLSIIRADEPEWAVPGHRRGARRAHGDGARPSADPRRSTRRQRRRRRPSRHACCSSPGRTCPARARCCAPSASTWCSRRPARPCARRRSARRRSRSIRASTSRTRSSSGCRTSWPRWRG